MKTLKFLTVFCAALLAVACIKTETNVEELPGEEIVLSLCPSGEILEVSDEPLSKAGLPSGTLYVVSVYQGSTQYAHGVFDDPSQMSLRLSTGKEFSIQVKAVKEGVSEISHAVSGEVQTYEGSGLLDNTFHYYASDKTDEAFYGNTSDIASLEDQWLLDTYYGALNVTPTAQTSNLTINLYRMMHAINIRVSGLEASDGTVSFTQSSYLPGTAEVSLSYSNPEYLKMAVINTDFAAVLSAITGQSDYSRTSVISADYASTLNGQPYTKKLVNAQTVIFYRNRKNVINLTLSHNYLGVDATFTFVVEGEDMQASDTDFNDTIDSGQNPPDNVAVTNVSLNKTTLNLVAGQTETLVATVLPDNATNKTVTWISSVPSVASVSDGGLVTAVSAGTSVITAKCGTILATCNVTVTAAGDNQGISASLSASSPFSASFTCTVEDKEGVTGYGVCYSEGNALCNNTVASHNMDANGTFTVDIVSLNPGATYYYKAYVLKGSAVSYSPVQSFSTMVSSNMIQTGSVSSVTAFSAQVSGSVDPQLLSYPNMTAGVCYSSTSATPTLSDSHVEASSIGNDGTFTVTAVGLLPNTQHNCRAYVKTGSNVTYGEVRVFTTDNSNAVVITATYTNLTHSSVTLWGQLNLGNISYSSLAYGIIFDGTVIMASDLDEENRFSISRAKLYDDTSHTYKAVATIDGNMFYGEEITFTTPRVPIHTEQTVDLGLSVLWAGYNIGATSPNERGNYFAWGEVQPKSTYTWKTYKYCMGNENTLTKYNSDSSYGIIDNLFSLQPADDAATENWGDDWRTPTTSEWSELYNDCEWFYTTYAGVKGFKAISKKPGYTDVAIFFPEAGSYDEDGFNTQSGYWSSKCHSQEAYFFYFYGNFIILNYSGGGRTREYGRTVRAVKTF